jgi:L,D-transpeptidase catalytic domain
MDENWELVNKTCTALGIKPADRCLLVRLGTQTLQLFRGGELVQAFPVSTSLRPASNVKDSLGTPRGLHEIAERIGGEQPSGMVFKGRRPTGRHFCESEDNGNLITSRILWLRGLEPGVNAGEDAEGRVVDTYARYVYIHGTNREDRIGQPQSAGCVLLANAAMIALYEQVRVGDRVLVVD